MSKKQIIRKKRFLLDNKENLKNKWASSKGELLTLTYDYSPLMSEDLEYREYIEIAVENFNRLGLARLVYQPVEMGRYLRNCTTDTDMDLAPVVDIEYLKFKYKNHFVFSYYKPRGEKDKLVCKVNFNLFYRLELREFFKPTLEDNTTLPPFAEIVCNPRHRNFSRIALGVIQHEFNHLLGMRHAHTIENTNGIFPVKKPRPNLANVNRGISTLLDVYSGYSSYYQVDNYTLISPFSIQHYSEEIYREYRVFNRTRMSELLDSYKVDATIKHHYFYLLDNYAGINFIYTYQDLFALASAIYHIAPDSLRGKRFNFLNYYFVDGMYLPKEDKLKFIEIVDTLSRVENFSYPFLWQENVMLTLKKDELFSKNMLDELKIVSLSNHSLSCSFQEESKPNSAKYFSVTSDCFIRGVLGVAGEYDIPVIFRQHKNELKYNLRLLVEEKSINRVFLAKKQTNFSMQNGSENFYVDLVDVCQVTAYPIEKRLRCGLMDSVLCYIPVQHCMFLVQDTANRNLSFIFLNGDANKTCFISFLLDDAANLALNKDDNLVNSSNRKLAREASFLTGEQEIASNPLSNWVEKFNYSITVPFSQGIIEGAIDSTSLHAYVKSGLKVSPRILLWYLDYLNQTNFFLLTGASFLEGAIKNGLKNKVSLFTEKFISIVLFLSITELEYGFSNLWTLSDQPRFFPELTDKFNQLFLQWFFSPMIKTLGYMLTVNLINLCLPSAPSIQEDKARSVAPLLHHENEVASEKSLPMTSSVMAAMQDAYQTVFSRKTFKLFAFFKVNSDPAHQVSSSDELSIGLRQS